MTRQFPANRYLRDHATRACTVVDAIVVGNDDDFFVDAPRVGQRPGKRIVAREMDELIRRASNRDWIVKADRAIG